VRGEVFAVLFFPQNRTTPPFLRAKRAKINYQKIYL
jgi:hypothetical protein